VTAQVGEQLILEGQETAMAFCPPIPDDHPRITQLSDEELHKRITGHNISSLIFSTACWRGYIGTWELKDGRFYLVSVQGRYRIEGTEPIFADWFTGVLRIPEGELLEYVHMGFGSVYEYETHIKIEKGIVVDERRIDNRNKKFDRWDLGLKNLPGFENLFDGDDL
jgi:hypothetical protein